jgi:acyl-[acyl-carrier-protein] desaturase
MRNLLITFNFQIPGPFFELIGQCISKQGGYSSGKKRIAMPAHFLRQKGEAIGTTFAHFSDAAQRLGVYTSRDYTHILESLIKEWNIGNLGSLTRAAEKARDYLISLPERFKKISERGLKAPVEYKFNWIR